MVTDLAGTQISSLMETLPGIAKVLRSPVADALITVLRAASGQGAFTAADADELLRFAVRRNLLGAEESEQVLGEVREALANQAAMARAVAKAGRASARAAKAAARARSATKPASKAGSARKPATRKPARPAARAKTARTTTRKPARAAKVARKKK